MQPLDEGPRVSAQGRTVIEMKDVTDRVVESLGRRLLEVIAQPLIEIIAPAVRDVLSDVETRLAREREFAALTCQLKLAVRVVEAAGDILDESCRSEDNETLAALYSALVVFRGAQS